MKDKSKLKKIKSIFTYLGKLLSTAVIVLLLIIGAFLLYYFISAKLVSKGDGYEPKIYLYTIVSGSMEPNIKVYDVVMDVKVDKPTDIKVGDVITFKSTSSISNGMIVTHRVIKINEKEDGNYEYITKGDFNKSADSRPAEFKNVIGKVFIKIPQIGRIQFFLATSTGWLIVVLLPALGVIIYDIIKVVKITKSESTLDKIDNGKSINNNDSLQNKINNLKERRKNKKEKENENKLNIIKNQINKTSNEDPR